MEKAGALGLLLFTVVMIVLFGVFTDYVPPTTASAGRYPYFQDVHIMIFIGFGFLMSFLHRGSFTATSHAFLVASYATAWALLTRGFFVQALKDGNEWTNILLSVPNLIGAEFAAGAVLISFGGMLGRLTATQLLVMAIIEVAVYSLNEAILLEKLYIADIGGSMIIHTFGAYFGLACSFVLEKANSKRQLIDNSAHGSTRVTDTMAMIGTIFLFCYWPSFNAALAGEAVQDRAVVNTYLSILASCIAGFLVCCLLDPKGKFGMVEIQNSTIAGGVAMGATADMFILPVGALIIGFVAGAVSVVGYKFLTPVLERSVGLRDTCGIHNLHGMPGIIGAIAATIAAGSSGDRSSYKGSYNLTFLKESQSNPTQAGHQIAALGVTLGFALICGAITGGILSVMPSLETFFEDANEYLVPDDEHAPVPPGPIEMTTKPTSTANEPVVAA